MIDVLWMALEDEKEYPDKTDEGYLALLALRSELIKADKKINAYKYKS